MLTETGRKKRVKKKARREPDFLSTGKLSKLIGVAPKTAAAMMDRHADLTYRINDDRRIHRSNLDKFLLREGIDRRHIGLAPSAAFVWVGRAEAGLAEVRDRVATPVAAMALLHAGETDGIAAFLHDLSADDLLRMAEACGRAGVRFAAVLPDDAPGLGGRASLAWLFRRDGGTDERAVMRWVRGVE